MKIKLVVIVAAVFLLVGCSPISSGVITDKSYYEAYDYPVSYCAAYNTKSQCIVWAQRQEHVNEKWLFSIKNDNKDTGWVSVSESEFEQYEVGDYYGKKR